jgi:hypothetical protein
MTTPETCYEAADLVDDVVTAINIRPTASERAKAEAAVIERLDRLQHKWIAREDQAAAKRAGSE